MKASSVVKFKTNEWSGEPVGGEIS